MDKDRELILRLKFTFVLMTLVATVLHISVQAQEDSEVRQQRRLKAYKLAKARALRAKHGSPYLAHRSVAASPVTPRAVSFEDYRLANASKPALSAKVAQSEFQTAFVPVHRPVIYILPTIDATPVTTTDAAPEMAPTTRAPASTSGQ